VFSYTHSVPLVGPNRAGLGRDREGGPWGPFIYVPDPQMLGLVLPGQILYSELKYQQCASDALNVIPFAQSSNRSKTVVLKRHTP
jgi:hypothetical protein